MKRKIIGIFVCTLLIATALSAVGTMNEKMCSTPSNNGASENVVWDNGMNYDALGTSQVDETINYDWIGADDFYFEEDTKVCGMRWIGGYGGTDYQQGNFDFVWQVHRDRGDGNAPGDIFAGPFTYTPEMYNPVFIEDTGSEIYYEYYIEFPNTIQFSGGEKYWMSGWGIGEFPTRSGVGYHYDPINLHQCVGKSEYEGHPDWGNVEDISTVVDSPIDVCFQLLASSPPAIPDITGPPSGKTGTSQEYTFSSTDPEGDDISYCIDWGDESGETCIGPFPSGEEIKSSHTWDEDGTYTIQIKAQDSHGFESDYATLQVSMPKTKECNNPFLQFLENHPHMFPLLRQLLGL